MRALQADLFVQFAQHGLFEALAAAHAALRKLPAAPAHAATQEYLAAAAHQDDADVGAEAVRVDDVVHGAF